ncbi:unnamed protein product, partial [marine sediment metagenome]
ALGKRDLFTDLDLIVIMNTPDNYIERTAELYRRLNYEVDLDLFVYTPEEFNDMKDGNFMRNVLLEGRVVYEK